MVYMVEKYLKNAKMNTYPCCLTSALLGVGTPPDVSMETLIKLSQILDLNMSDPHRNPANDFSLHKYNYLDLAGVQSDAQCTFKDFFKHSRSRLWVRGLKMVTSDFVQKEKIKKVFKKTVVVFVGMSGLPHVPRGVPLCVCVLRLVKWGLKSTYIWPSFHSSYTFFFFGYEIR